MTIFTNSTVEKEKSEKICSELFRSETIIDMSAVPCSKMMPKKKLIDWEAFFEKLAGSDKKFTSLYQLLTNLATFANLFVFFISIIGPGEEINGIWIPLPTWKNLLLWPVAFGSFVLHGSPQRYEYRRHFSDINYDCHKVIIFFFSAYVGSTIGSISYVWFKIIVTVFTLTIGLNFVIDFINAQKATKLRFDPCEDNNLYKLIHAESKDKGTIRIIESSVFKITIKNIGTESWDSTDCDLHRHTGTGKNGQCFAVTLPQFILSPQAQVDLIPETAEYDGECVRVPKIHCFGLRDRHSQVKTFISNGRSSVNMQKEENYIKPCSYETKIAEHIATYNENEWSNISPCLLSLNANYCK